MNITKAIEVLKTHPLLQITAEDHDIRDATLLAIEALKAFKDFREARLLYPGFILPGETEDYCPLCGIAHYDSDCPQKGRFG